MEVISLPSRSSCDDPFRRDVDRLIDTVGTANFEIELFRTAAQSIRCDHLSAFSVSSTHPPRLLFAVNAGKDRIALSAGRAYVGRFWNLDPTNRLLSGTPCLTSGLLVSVPSEEVAKLRYRRAIYSRADWETSGANLIHKMSLIKSHGCDTLKINFYRSRNSGSFAEADRRKIIDSASLLVALVGRHAALDARDDAETLRKRFEFWLTTAGLGLTRREIQVCAGIAVGMTSEGLALALDVGLNTILTHRKRAYARLGISSQNELVRLIYSRMAIARPGTMS